MRTSSSSFAPVLALVLVVACGTDHGGTTTVDAPGGGGGGGGCVPYVVPTGTDLTKPVVSFQHDVMKVFDNNCSAAQCHGSATSPQGGLFLGVYAKQGNDAAVVRTGLVNKAGAELGNMMFVTPGDPSSSFLMHKMDGDQCMFAMHCAGNDCHGLMPSGSTPLPVATRDTVRRWIAQGALAN